MSRTRRALTSQGWAVLALGTAAVALVLGLVAAPADAVQGEAQRLMYIHVPAAWTAYVCFAAVLVASVAYLVRRDRRWDDRARAAVATGVAMTALTLATGSLWGLPTWGTAWTWDARLVSTAVLLLVYLGYLAVRHAGRDADHGARLAAVTGIAGFAMVPVVHFSVLWWRTLHQPPTILGPSTNPPIDATMAAALAASVIAFQVLALWTISRRYAALRTAATSHQRVTAGRRESLPSAQGGGRT